MSSLYALLAKISDWKGRHSFLMATFSPVFLSMAELQQMNKKQFWLCKYVLTNVCFNKFPSSKELILDLREKKQQKKKGPLIFPC